MNVIFDDTLVSLPIEKKVHVYRPGLPVEILDDPAQISGDPPLKGFVLKLEGILD